MRYPLIYRDPCRRGRLCWFNQRLLKSKCIQITDLTHPFSLCFVFCFCCAALEPVLLIFCIRYQVCVHQCKTRSRLGSVLFNISHVMLSEVFDRLNVGHNYWMAKSLICILNIRQHFSVWQNFFLPLNVSQTPIWLFHCTKWPKRWYPTHSSLCCVVKTERKKNKKQGFLICFILCLKWKFSAKRPLRGSDVPCKCQTIRSARH